MKEGPQNSKVIDLSARRRQKRLLYLKTYQSALQEFLTGFIRRNFKTDIQVLHHHYLLRQVQSHELSYEFDQFRQDVGDAIWEVYGETLWYEVQAERWFDRQCLSQEELVEHCTSLFILGSAFVANE